MKHLTSHRLIDEIARTGSIRKAAENMALTPSAVQRRLQAFEEELGEVIFERFAYGVRLNSAGELVILHIRQQLAETERLKSRLADLSGVRRGHVSIACSQALTPYFLPDEIARYMAAFPHVTFDVQVQEHSTAAQALNDYEADLALVFDASNLPGFEVITAVPQRIHAIMARGHPLAGNRALRLRDCLRFPLALPTQNFGGRTLFDKSISARSLTPQIALESNSFEYLKAHVTRTDAITFQIPIGAPDLRPDSEIVTVEISDRDVWAGLLFLGQLKGRTLSVASSRFVEQITRSLLDRYGTV